jgi:tetratricopeptide (TPR) repeat protein
MTSERSQLVERRDMVRRDLDELTEQVESGEVDQDTADRLRSAYQAELDQLDRALAGLPPAKPEPHQPVHSARPVTEVPEARTRSPRRVVAGAAILIGALTIAIFFAARGTEPDPVETASGSPGALTVDPASVSNEQLEAVVEANPDITAMRMALADRYFEAEQWNLALDHYLYIAENTVNPGEETKALARVGWMAYITEQPDAADEYFVRALAIDPSNAEAILFQAFNTMYGLQDPAAAIPQLEAALELTNISDNVISQIEESLEEAKAATS